MSKHWRKFSKNWAKTERKLWKSDQRKPKSFPKLYFCQSKPLLFKKNPENQQKPNWLYHSDRFCSHWTLGGRWILLSNVSRSPKSLKWWIRLSSHWPHKSVRFLIHFCVIPSWKSRVIKRGWKYKVITHLRADITWQLRFLLTDLALHCCSWENAPDYFMHFVILTCFLMELWFSKHNWPSNQTRLFDFLWFRHFLKGHS